MRSLVIKLLIFLTLFSLTPLLGSSDVMADGNLFGRVFMNYKGIQYSINTAHVNKIADCKSLRDNLCEDVSCKGGSGFCPSKPQPYYTRDNGNYSIVAGDGASLIVNGQPSLCSQGGVEIACGINCGYGAHEFKALLPANFDKNNFPQGIDFRPGYFRAVSSTTELSKAGGRIITAGRDQYYHLDWTNNETNNPDLDFEWVPDPANIAGKVTDASGKGVAGIGIVVHREAEGVSKDIPVTTGADGSFSLPNEVQKGDLYSVRVNPAMVTDPYQKDKTRISTTTFSKIYDGGALRDTPATNSSYEFQLAGKDDCAGPDSNGTAGRCNFTLNANDPVTATPEPACTITSVHAPGSTVVAVTINEQTIPVSSNGSISIKLPGNPKKSDTFLLPVMLKYSDNTCETAPFAINYEAPLDCSGATDKPNSCSCNSDAECRGGACINNSCNTKPFIDTRSGDVHSNTEINLPGGQR